MSRTIILCFFVLAAFPLLGPALGRAADGSECNAKPPTKPILLTGNAGLNYDMVGRAIADTYNLEVPPDKRKTVCGSDGSLQNVQKLSSNDGTFALVQSASYRFFLYICKYASESGVRRYGLHITGRSKMRLALS